MVKNIVNETVNKNNFLYLYFLVKELIDLEEYSHIANLIVVGNRREAFLFNLFLKPKGVKVNYVEENDFSHYLEQLNSGLIMSKEKTKYFIVSASKKLIRFIRQSEIKAENYIILPIYREK